MEPTNQNQDMKPDLLDTDRASESRLRVRPPSSPVSGRVPSAAAQEFLREVSHELRAPLANILAYASLIERGDGERLSVQGSEDLAAIGTLARNALGIIDDLLQSSRPVEDRAPRREIVSFVGLAQRCSQQVRTYIGDKPVELTFHVAPDAERGYADPVKLEQIVSNLLTNAARFTDYGSIAVYVKREGTLLYLEVRDTGVGIPLEHQARIFERGEQLKVPGEERGGTGLGLAIVERICAELKGEIWLESRPGWGSRFVVELPDVFPLGAL